MTTEVETSSSDSVSPQAAPPRRSLLRRLLRGLANSLLALLMTGVTVWAALAILFADTHFGPRRVLAVLYVLVALAVVWFVRPRRRLVLSLAGLFAAVLGWFFLLKPSNTRDWAPEVAQLPWADIKGDRLTLTTSETLTTALKLISPPTGSTAPTTWRS